MQKKKVQDAIVESTDPKILQCLDSLRNDEILNPVNDTQKLTYIAIIRETFERISKMDNGEIVKKATDPKDDFASLIAYDLAERRIIYTKDRQKEMMNIKRVRTIMLWYGVNVGVDDRGKEKKTA